MKKSIYIIISYLWIIAGLVGCDSENDFIVYDTNNSYIYFNTADSLEYSFAFDPSEVTSYTFKVPIAISGIATDRDREYKIEIIEEETTATNNEYDISQINPIVRKGLGFDTLYITVNRTEILKTEKKSISIELLDNEEFKQGREDRLKAKIIFSDIVIEPIWWEDWESIFGPFYIETYLKWKEIYYEGADKNLPSHVVGASKDANIPMYWDNMPTGKYATNEYFSPSLFMYLNMLKDYFEENEVYGTNPDGTKTRIKITIPEFVLT